MNDPLNDMSAPFNPLDELTRDKKTKKDRNNKRIFRVVADSEGKDMYSLYDAINPNALQGSNAQERSNLVAAGTSTLGNKMSNMATTGHRLLITPNAYNILLAYKPTTDFMNGLEDRILG
jgi:hypothetical protein